MTTTAVCRHHWMIAPSWDWCDCDDMPVHHHHAWCRECAAERVYRADDWGDRELAREYGRRGAKAKWGK
jgi:hypothetical protein